MRIEDIKFKKAADRAEKRGPIRPILIFALTAIALFFVFKSILIRGETAKIYPQNCFGSWQNPQKATGGLNKLALNAPPDSFTGDNSAVYLGDGSNFYCNDFQNNFTGNFIGAQLVFNWAIKDKSSLQTPVINFTISPTSSTPLVQNIPTATSNLETTTPAPAVNNPPSTTTASITSTTTVNEPVATSSLPNQPLLPQSTSSTSSSTSKILKQNFLLYTFYFLTSKAFAQEASTSPVLISTTSPIIINRSSTSPITLPVSTSSSSTTSTSTPASFLPTNLDDIFEIDYSLDGNNWLALARINKNNFQNPISLPLNNFNDINKLTIRIQPLPNLQDSAIFLNSLWIEAQYQPESQSLTAFTTSTPKELSEKEFFINPKSTFKSFESPVFTINPNIFTGQINVSPSQPSDLTPLIGVPSNQTSSLLNQTINQPQTTTTPAPIVSASSSISSLTAPTSSNPVSPTTTTTNNIIVPEATSSSSTLSTSSTAPETTSTSSTTSKLGNNNFFASAFFYFSSKFQGLINKLSYLTSRAWAQTPPISVQLYDPDGALSQIQPIITPSNGSFTITLPKERFFRPGKYTMTVTTYANSVPYVSTTDFTWGVLAINFDRSIYTLGQQSQIYMAVLDNRGNTVCNASLSLQVTAPDGSLNNFSTSDGTISKSSQCGPTTVTYQPDYWATFTPNQTGNYQITLTAITEDGVNSISDSFSVQNFVAFDVQRQGPIRIYPLFSYKMRININPSQDYTGPITEVVPSWFKITDISNNGKFLPNDAQSQLITWLLHLKHNIITTLEYEFKAPDISPQLYLLGPLQIGSFQETRSWQIAADAISLVSTTTCSNGGATTISCTWSSAPTNGNALVAVIGTRGTSANPVSSISETGATWSEAATVTNTNGITTDIWYALNVSGAATGVTINLASSLKASAVLTQYAGLATSNALDVVATSTGSSAAPVTGTTTVTTLANELWVGGLANINTNTYSSPTNGFTLETQIASTGGSATTKNNTGYLDKIVSATGQAGTGATLSGTQQWAGAIATFKTPVISIAGTIYADEGATTVTTSPAIALKISGDSTLYTTTTASNGTYQFNNANQPATGADMTVFLNTAGGINGTTIDRYSGSGNVTGLNIYLNRIIARHDDAGPVTISDMANYDNTSNSGIKFTATTTGSTIMNVFAGNELHVWTGDTFSPGGNVTTPAFHIVGTSTPTLGETFTITDAGIPGSNIATTTPFSITGGTFNSNTSTISFVSTSSINIWPTTYNTLTLVPTSSAPTYTLGTGASQTIAVNATTTIGDGTNSVTITAATNNPTVSSTGNFVLNNAATFTAGSGAINLGSNLTLNNASTWNSGTGTITFNGSGTDTLTDNNSTKQNLGAVSISGSSLTLNLGSSIKATTVSIAASQTLSLNGANTLYLTGSGTALSNSGTFTGSSGTVEYDSNTGATVSALTGTNKFNNLTINGSGTFTIVSGTLTVGGNLNITSSTLSAVTNNPTIQVGGSLTIGANGKFTKGSGALTFNGTGTQTWTDSEATKSDMGGVTLGGTSETINLGSTVLVTTTTINSSQTLGLGTNTFRISGSGTGAARPLQNSGSITGTTGAVQYESTASTDIDNSIFLNITLASASANTYTIFSNSTVTSSGLFTINTSNTLNPGSGEIDLTGSGTPLVINGVFNPQASTVKYLATSATNITATSYNNLNLQPNGAGSPVYTLGTAGSQTITNTNMTIGDGTNTVSTTAATWNPLINVTSTLTINTNGTLSGGAAAITLSGSGVPLTVLGGTFAANTSLVKYTGTSNLTVASTTFYNLTLAPSAAGSPIYTLPNGTLAVNNNFTLGDSTNALTVGAAANNPVLNVTATTTLNNASTFKEGTSTTTLSGDLILNNTSTFTSSTGSIVFAGSGTNVLQDNNATKQDLGIVYIQGSSKTIKLGSNILATDITIASNNTFDTTASNYNITLNRNFTNNGTFNANADTVTFQSAYASNISSAATTTFNVLSVNKAATSTIVQFMSGTYQLNATSTITLGTLSLNNSTTTVYGVNASSNGYWLSTSSTGSVYLGAGGVTNTGSITFNGGAGKAVLLRSTASPTQRHWNGTGVFSMSNIDVQDQYADTPNPGSITCVSCINSGNNTNWSFGASLTVTIDSNSVNLGNLVPGTPVTGNSFITVTITGGTNGYAIQENKNNSTTTVMTLNGTTPIPDMTAWDNSQNSGNGNAVVFTASTQALGFRVQSTSTTSNYNSTWWGVDDTNANAKYAGFTTSTGSTTVLMNCTTCNSGTTTTTLKYKQDAPTTQAIGSYSGGVTYTVYSNP